MNALCFWKVEKNVSKWMGQYFKFQVYEWGGVRNTGPHIRTRVTRKLLPPPRAHCSGQRQCLILWYISISLLHNVYKCLTCMKFRWNLEIIHSFRSVVNKFCCSKFAFKYIHWQHNNCIDITSYLLFSTGFQMLTLQIWIHCIWKHFMCSA